MPNTKTLEGFTILTNQEINPDLVLEIGREVFKNEPSETKQGIEFLLKYGAVLALVKDAEFVGFAESISLAELLNPNNARIILGTLPNHSPLRNILRMPSSTNRISI